MLKTSDETPPELTDEDESILDRVWSVVSGSPARTAREFDPENAHRLFKFDPKLHPKGKGGRFLAKPKPLLSGKPGRHDREFPTEAAGNAGRSRLHAQFEQMMGKSLSPGSDAKKSSQARVVDRLMGDPEFMTWASRIYTGMSSGGNAHDRGAAEHVVREAVHSWAISSTSGLAGRIQHLAIQEFGLKSANRKRLDPFGPFSKAGEFDNKQYRKILRTQYEETQRDFAEMGITHVKLYRGTSSGRVKETGGMKTSIGLKPLSSWATDMRTATDAFASGVNTGRVFEAIIPVRRIHSTPRTGLGCLTEYEAVVMGGAPTHVRSYTIEEAHAHPSYDGPYKPTGKKHLFNPSLNPSEYDS